MENTPWRSKTVDEIKNRPRWTMPRYGNRYQYVDGQILASINRDRDDMWVWRVKFGDEVVAEGMALVLYLAKYQAGLAMDQVKVDKLSN